MSATPIRACAAGAAEFLGHDSTSFGGRFFCPGHQWSLLHRFNPQPHGVAGGTDGTVRLIDGGQADLVVLARAGDILTVRQLGLPDSTVRTVQVSEVYPAAAGAAYRHMARCGRPPK